jgi:transglutaminase-like putative cysteine protease
MRRALFALLAAGSLAKAADDVPAWVRQAAGAPAPSYSAKVSSVVLLQEEAVTVDAEGHRVMRERGAIRSLQAGGPPIQAFRTYNTKSGRIRDFQGWMVPVTGKALTYPKNRVIDVEISPNWDEERAKLLEAGPMPPGSVFAWEVTEEEKTVFTQYAYRFQDWSPVLDSRLTLTLPAGWEVRGTTFNHANLDPKIDGSTYTWELRDLAWVEQEDYSPTLAALTPRVMVSYFPPSDNRAGLQGLKDWTAVSSWLSRLMDPPAAVTPAIQAKAAQLTAGAASVLDKIRAIARFTQSTTYVSVDMNVTRGGGYTPHRAEETLAHNYGDCKDKTALMRALLKAAGIDSYALAIYAGDRTYARPEWASPTQFNHAIVAVRVSPDIALPSVLADSPAGGLLIFDPTDPVTPVGDLPRSEQGSFALLIAPERGALLQMPLMPATSNRIESTVDAVINAAGHVDARYERQYYGQSGAGLLEADRVAGRDEIKKRFERGLSQRLSAVSLKQVELKPERNENRLAVTLDLSAERFGQIMQNRLLVVRPGLLSSGSEYRFLNRQRAAPVRLEADVRRESIRIKLPEGFKFDEVPAPAKIESAYGNLETQWSFEGGEIVMKLALEVRDTVAPASDYSKVREFFESVAGAENAAVVLLRATN